MSLRNVFLSTARFDSEMLYTGMFGLAEALACIHSFTFKDGEEGFSMIGYHHDLKPANILLRNKTFVISDFGLSNLKSQDKTSKTNLKGGTEDYLGPEAFNEIDRTNEDVGRGLDIWAFGCVLAEFATYIELGASGVEDYRQARKSERILGRGLAVTDYSFHLGGQIRPAVDKWLERLKVTPADPEIPFLVELVRKMLEPSWQIRIKIAETVEQLRRISFHSKLNHIQKLFSVFSDDIDQTTPSPQVLILLEKMRFAVWSDWNKPILGTQNFEDLEKVVNVLDQMQISIRRKIEAPQLGDAGLRSLLETMILYNDDLYSLLSKADKAFLDQAWVEEITGIDDIEMMERIRDASRLDRYRPVGIKAAMKHICLAITKARRIGGTSRLIEKDLIRLSSNLRTRQTLSIAESSLPRSVEGDNRLIGVYESDTGPREVLIEWKNYDRQWVGDRGDEMLARAEALAKLLNPEETPREGILKHRILDCLGYFHDASRWRLGFVYQIPSSDATALKNKSPFLSSLNNIIRASNEEDSPRPLLGDLFSLAHSITACVFALHNVGWLHKNISSHMLITFCNDPGMLVQQVSSSYLAGFDESRREDSNVSYGLGAERVLYQHPRYRLRKSGYRRTFDYFSVGIVLLEIGLWATISSIHECHPELNDESGERFRVKLLESYVPQLGERMGARYLDAVEFCLDVDSTQGVMELEQEEDRQDQKREQVRFTEYVINRLAGCSA
jgi:serine/threonine protein kinase